MTAPACVRVDLAGSGYDVLVGHGLLGGLGDLVAQVGQFQRIHIFEDAGVPATLRDAAAGSFGKTRITRSEFRLDESSKSLATLERMLVDLAEAELERSDLVVALGGGILGDVAGLAAGLHRRGVRVVQCPTTLLAMVDASVGGKTGVNLRAGIGGKYALLKNAVGVFHQPSLVVADVDALASLSPRDLRGGLAECIKHAVIAGRTGRGLLDLDSLISALPDLLTGDRECLISLVHDNVGLKASIVAGDEREMATGSAPGRRALNLGHTFAHAIEACETTRVEVDGELVHPSHGEAVGLGLIAAARMAEAVSGDGAMLGALGRAISSAGLPTRLVAGPDANTLIATMRQDKKASGGTLRLVMPTPEGVAMLDDPGDPVLAEAWSAVI
ncbi:MAG: 3-dehydroquinate synthase family protein [Phycisphaerales bacterium JB064]